MTVFVDSNIPMYLVGAAHPNREAAVRRLDELITRDERLVTDCTDAADPAECQGKPVAEYSVTEFLPTMTSDALAGLRHTA